MDVKFWYICQLCGCSSGLLLVYLNGYSAIGVLARKPLLTHEIKS